MELITLVLCVLRRWTDLSSLHLARMSTRFSLAIPGWTDYETMRKYEEYCLEGPAFDSRRAASVAELKTKQQQNHKSSQLERFLLAHSVEFHSSERNECANVVICMPHMLVRILLSQLLCPHTGVLRMWQCISILLCFQTTYHKLCFSTCSFYLMERSKALG